MKKINSDLKSVFLIVWRWGPHCSHVVAWLTKCCPPLSPYVQGGPRASPRAQLHQPTWAEMAGTGKAWESSKDGGRSTGQVKLMMNMRVGLGPLPPPCEPRWYLSTPECPACFPNLGQAQTHPRTLGRWCSRSALSQEQWLRTLPLPVFQTWFYSGFVRAQQTLRPTAASGGTAADWSHILNLVDRFWPMQETELGARGRWGFVALESKPRRSDLATQGCLREPSR